jgi:hypothetical protein
MKHLTEHLTETELIDYGYGEGDRSAIEGHLFACPDCEKAYGELQLELAEMKFVEPPARDADYGQRVWERLEGRLPAYAARKRSWLGITGTAGWWRVLSYAAACAVLVAGGFAGGRLWDHWQAQISAKNHPAPPPVNTAQPPRRVVVVVLSDHLDRSERLLVELKHVDADSTEMVSPLRDEAKNLLTANRICRKEVKQDDDPALGTALDHLDTLLAELANEPGGLNKATIARLQDEMNTDGLLFEVRVLRSRISQGRGISHARGASHAQGAGAKRLTGGTV